MDDSASINPRPVSRGLKLQPAFIGLDSLYLVVEYPHKDVFDYWSSHVDMNNSRLFDGVPVDGLLIKRGALGYKLGVWDGDARLFITDRVDDELVNTGAVGQGMGVMLQLGPKWLRVHGDYASYETLSESVFDLLRTFRLAYPEEYPIRINRLDIALDVGGLSVADFSVDEWRRGWIGRASGKHFYDDNRTGKLSGLAIGSSKGAVRFKVYDKILEATKGDDLMFWLSVWHERLSDNMGDYLRSGIARFEWSFKPHSAKFIKMRYLSDYSFSGIKELLNYAIVKWGRLCFPQVDKNQSRWETHSLWVKIRRMLIDEWDIHQVGCAKREYHLEPDLNTSYLNSVTGWLGGLMARVGIEKRLNSPADIYDAVMLAEGKSNKSIAQKAIEKWELLSPLVGENQHEQE